MFTPVTITAAVLTPLLIQLAFWFVTGLVALLIAIVGKLYWDNRKLRKSAVDSAVDGIRSAVEELSSAIKALARRTDAHLESGEKRMDGMDTRLTTQETKCRERHRNKMPSC